MDTVRCILGLVIGLSVFGAFRLIDIGYKIQGLVIMLLTDVLLLCVGAAIGLGVL